MKKLVYFLMVGLAFTAHRVALVDAHDEQLINKWGGSMDKSIAASYHRLNGPGHEGSRRTCAGSLLL